MTAAADLAPEGSPMQQAVRWIAAQRLAARENGVPEPPVAELVVQAGFRFDLAPEEQERLVRFCRPD